MIAWRYHAVRRPALSPATRPTVRRRSPDGVSPLSQGAPAPAFATTLESNLLVAHRGRRLPRSSSPKCRATSTCSSEWPAPRRDPDRYALEERLLQVKGELHTYRIPFGSGSILMSPNGRLSVRRPHVTRRRPITGTASGTEPGGPSISLMRATVCSLSSSARRCCSPRTRSSRTRRSSANCDHRTVTPPTCGSRSGTGRSNNFSPGPSLLQYDGQPIFSYPAAQANNTQESVP